MSGSQLVNVTQAVQQMTDNPACTKCSEGSADCFDMNQAMWPIHCLDSGDSALAAAMVEKPSDITIKKGTNIFVDSYSAFMDNTKHLKTELDNILQAAGVTEIYVAGIATDFCVAWSAEDAKSL